jgi:hypothetical protein
MRKIPTIFIRDWQGDKSKVLPQYDYEHCVWVLNGEGIATRKFDGTAVMIQDGKLFRRYDAKHGKNPPVDFVAAQPEFDPETGHWPGWVPAGSHPQYQWQRAAFEELKLVHATIQDGTYEACGPHFQGNPEHLEKDILIPHGHHKYLNAPRTFEELKEFFAIADIEGLVWHHPDGRMAKIKKRDFGLTRTEA